MDIKRNYKFALRPYSKGQSFLILLRLTFNGYRLDFATGCAVREESAWDSEQCIVKKGYLSPGGICANDQNRIIQQLVDNLEECFKYYEVISKKPTGPEFKAYYEKKYVNKTKAKAQSNLGSDSDVAEKDLVPKKRINKNPEEKKKSRKKNFWDRYAEFVQDNGTKNAWTDATYAKFKALKNDLMSFKKNLSFNDFTEKGLTDFVCYLRDSKEISSPTRKPNAKGKVEAFKVGCNNTTIHKKLGYLKWFLKWATVKGYNKCIDYQVYTVTLKSTQRKVIFLTKDELHKIMTLEIPKGRESLERVRDVFIFCCFCGIRYSDVYNLRKRDIADGIMYITTVKTADSIRIELNNITQRILDKYKDQKFPDDKALPVLSNQHMNLHLKDLCRMAGIDEPICITTYKGSTRHDEVHPKYELIGTHTARRSFICNMLSLGVTADIVMKWTGHSDYKAMKPYIDIADKAKAAEMTKINSLDLDVSGAK